jgi:hypothetical protein
MRYVSQRFLNSQPLSHHALKDALDQADIFKQVLEALKTNNLTPSRGKL